MNQPGKMDTDNEFRSLMAQFVALRLARNSKSVPPAGYLCHLCYEPGHYIKNCRLYVTRDEGLTPYQGTKRCFGVFRCSRCKRRWWSDKAIAMRARTATSARFTSTRTSSGRFCVNSVFSSDICGIFWHVVVKL